MTRYGSINEGSINGAIHSIFAETEFYVDFWLQRDYTTQDGTQNTDFYPCRAVNGNMEKIKEYIGMSVLLNYELFNKKVPYTTAEGEQKEYDDLILKTHKVLVLAIEEPVNHGVLTGNIASFRTASDGSKIFSYESGDKISIAIAYNNRVFNEETKEWEDNAQFFNAGVWFAPGKADSFLKYEKKSPTDKAAAITAGFSLSINKWTDKEGNERQAIAVNINTVQCFKSGGGSRDGNGATGYAPPSLTPINKKPAAPKTLTDKQKAEIPF